MLPGRIEGSTRILGAPSSWDPSVSGPCAGLAVRDLVDNGLPWMVSSWEPTPEELAQLVAGGRIQLWVQGVSHPVVALGVVMVEEAALS